MQYVKPCLVLVMAMTLGLLGSATLAGADVESEFNDVVTAFQNGKFSLNARARFEHAEMDGKSNSDAYTLRTRLGYGTAQYRHLSGYLEFENVAAVDKNKYNGVVDGNPDRTVIADPEVTELNQAYLRYDFPEAYPIPGALIYGRQRIVLDDHRFVGDVGWRQDNQTFDAAVFQSSFGVDGLTFTYGYIDYIRGILADKRDLDSKSHVFNVHYVAAPEAKLTFFGYLLDVPKKDMVSSDTFGVRITGDVAVQDDLNFGYAASYARQKDAANNPTSYDTEYIALDAKLGCKKFGAFGVGLEVLGSDSGKHQFVTPLATGHKFNGWADAFVLDNGGTDGLRDYYAYVAPALPWGLKAKAVYHVFKSDQGAEDAGTEIDLLLVKPINEHVKLLTKYADYNGGGNKNDSTASGRNDVNRFWLQAEFVF